MCLESKKWIREISVFETLLWKKSIQLVKSTFPAGAFQVFRFYSVKSIDNNSISNIPKSTMYFYWIIRATPLQSLFPQRLCGRASLAAAYAIIIIASTAPDQCTARTTMWGRMRVQRNCRRVSIFLFILPLPSLVVASSSFVCDDTLFYPCCFAHRSADWSQKMDCRRSGELRHLAHVDAESSVSSSSPYLSL